MAPLMIPFVSVKDVEASIEYYTTLLGFSLDRDSHYPGQHAGIFFGGDSVQTSTATMFLRKATSAEEGATAVRPTVDLCIWLREQGKGKEVVDEVYESCVARGAVPKEKPEDKPWKCRQASFEDPDGYTINFYSNFRYLP